MFVKKELPLILSFNEIIKNEYKTTTYLWKKENTKLLNIIMTKQVLNVQKS